MSKQRRALRGMTIIEILYSIVILGIGLVGLMQLFMVATTMNSRAEDTQFALDVATRALEGLQDQPFDLIAATSFDEEAAGHSTVHVAVGVANHDTYEDVKVVSLEATWDGRSKGTVALETLIARNQ